MVVAVVEEEEAGEDDELESESSDCEDVGTGTSPLEETDDD